MLPLFAAEGGDGWTTVLVAALSSVFTAFCGFIIQLVVLRGKQNNRSETRQDKKTWELVEQYQRERDVAYVRNEALQARLSERDILLGKKDTAIARLAERVSYLEQTCDDEGVHYHRRQSEGSDTHSALPPGDPPPGRPNPKE